MKTKDSSLARLAKALLPKLVKRNYRNFAGQVAQRRALPAGGRDETRRRNGKSPKPRKRQKTRRVPTCPLHTLLGVFKLHKTP